MNADTLFDGLLDLIDAGSVVPIVGQELLTVRHQNRELRLYDLVAQRLAAHPQIQVSGDNLPEGDELNTVACRFQAKGGSIEDLYGVLHRVMPPPTELDIPEPLLKLAEITAFKLFVSTTFDPLLARALDQVRYGGRQETQLLAYTHGKVTDLPAEINRLGQPCVYHLLGRVSPVPLSYAITQEDVLEFVHSLQTETRQPKLLIDELSNSSLLVLGASFGGWLARFFLRASLRKRFLEVRGKTDYIADSGIEQDQNLTLFLHHFAPRTQIYNGGAASFVDELHRRWYRRHGQKNAKQPVSSAQATNGMKTAKDDEKSFEGGVFLSYARGDELPVSELKRSLEAAGVDVFFDRDDLQTGEDYDVRLMDAIRNCRVFVPVISGVAIQEERGYRYREWGAAEEELTYRRDKSQFILPIALDHTSLDASGIPEKFKSVHWSRLPADRQAFIERVRSIVSGSRGDGLAQKSEVAG